MRQIRQKLAKIESRIHMTQKTSAMFYLNYLGSEADRQANIAAVKEEYLKTHPPASMYLFLQDYSGEIGPGKLIQTNVW